MQSPVLEANKNSEEYKNFLYMIKVGVTGSNTKSDEENCDVYKKMLAE